MTPEQTGRHLLGPALVTRLERHLAPPLLEDLCRHVAAVAAQERAACAACCDTDDSPRWDDNDCCKRTAAGIADAIRSRAAP